MVFKEQKFGLSFSSNEFHGVFGDHRLIRSTYQAQISDHFNTSLHFSYSNQVHGDGILIVDKRDTQPEEADALITGLTKQALVVKTADCLPIFLINHTTRKFALIHAGWRGVFNDISLRALRLLKETKRDEIEIVIGPHIRKSSFQVKEELVKLFKSKFKFIKEPSHVTKDLDEPGHYYMDLSKILKDRLHFELRDGYKLHDCEIDTFAHSRFHSYRRDGDKSGRNLALAFKAVP